LQALVEFARVFEVDHVDEAIRGSDHAKVITHIQTVHALLAVNRERGTLLPEIPVLDGLVPRARDEHGVTVGFEPTDGTDGLVVRANGDILLRGEIADFDVLVGACRGDFGSVLYTFRLAMAHPS
jgi:hypothetical protein